MRKYLSIVVASVIGGAISVAIYSNLTNKQTAYVPSDSTLQGARPMEVGYSGMVDFTAAASATVDAVVHVKIRSQYTVVENPIYNFLFGRPNYQQQEMPVVASGRASASTRNVCARKKIPIPVMTHARITATTAAPCAMFCGKLNMPPPIIAPTTSATSAITPSFLLSPSVMFPLLD